MNPGTRTASSTTDRTGPVPAADAHDVATVDLDPSGLVGVAAVGDDARAGDDGHVARCHASAARTRAARGPRCVRGMRRTIDVRAGPELLGVDRDLGHDEPGPLGPQDQLGVEEIAPEPAARDDGKQRLAPQRLHAVRVAHREAEPDAQHRRERRGDEAAAPAAAIVGAGRALRADDDRAAVARASRMRSTARAMNPMS